MELFCDLSHHKHSKKDSGCWCEIYIDYSKQNCQKKTGREFSDGSLENNLFWFCLQKHREQMENGKRDSQSKRLSSMNIVNRVNRQPVEARHLASRWLINKCIIWINHSIMHMEVKILYSIEKMHAVFACQ